MAKEKKTETKSESAPKASAKKPAAAAAGKSKSAKKPSATGGNALGIDTNLVAQVAAMAVGNKALMHERQAEPEDQGEKKESSTFKNLKDSLAKPGSSTLSSFLQSSTSPAAKKASNLPFGGGGKQTGRNQTYGADVTRSGVPRRTPG